MVATPYNKKANPVFLVDQTTGTPYAAAASGGGAVTNAGVFAVQNTAATPAGAAIIGRVGIDQTTDGTTNRVSNVEAGDSYARITTAATTVVKASAGVIKKIIINSKGTVASTVSVQDSATVLALIDSLNLAGTFEYNITCATNITIVTTGTVAPDVTVTYR